MLNHAQNELELYQKLFIRLYNEWENGLNKTESEALAAAVAEIADNLNDLFYCDVIRTQASALEARVKELEEQVRWKPITPESLPKAGDEVYGESGTASVSLVPAFPFQYYSRLCKQKWTHYRSINPPAKEGK